MSPRRFVLSVLALALAAGCNPVRKTYLRPDYAQVDRQQTKRLVIVTHPAPDGKPAVADLWSQVARDYVNLKRQFIVKQQLGAQPEVEGVFDPRTVCGEGLEGVLWLNPRMTARGQGFETGVKAFLLRCSDGQTVWSAEAGGSWPSRDEKLQATAQIYTEQFGPEVEPYVAPTFQLLRATLDTLPDPVLTDEDKDEKIEFSALWEG